MKYFAMSAKYEIKFAHIRAGEYGQISFLSKDYKKDIYAVFAYKFELSYNR